jgi:hypothetical protein
MNKFTVAMIAGASTALLLLSAPADAQGCAPWPPPPGMTAGEYAARYGHLAQSGRCGSPRAGRRWEADRYYDAPRERSYRRSERQRRWEHYDDEDDYF